MTSYVVVWDGRKDGPGGAMLFAPQPSALPAPVIRSSVYGDACGRVRALRETFGDQPFTAEQVATLTQMTPRQASNALSTLVRLGDITRLRRVQFTRRQYRFRQMNCG